MTPPTQLVLGAGTDAIRVAAALVKHQHSVLVCLTAPAVSAELACVERGSWRGVSSEHLSTVVGPVQQAAESSVGIVARGSAHSLPIPPWTVGQLLRRGERRQTARSWVRARARNGLAVVVGGGQEERSYLDWVSRRMGRAAFEALYADYAGRRWGRTGDGLAASVARQTHGRHVGGSRVEPVDCADHGVRRAQAVLDAAGVEVISAPAARLHMEKGRVVGLEGVAGRSVRGPVWCTLSPREVAQRLQDGCPDSVRHLAAALSPAASCRIRLRGALTGLPDELHILDPGPCWRYVRAPDRPDDWIVSVTGASLSGSLTEDIRDHARQLGIVGEGAEVIAAETLPGGLPVWGPSDHARLRTVLEVWQKLGLRAVGRGGTYAELDPTQVLAHLAAVVDGAELLEAWRLHVAPAARTEDLDARITQFFAAS